MSLRAQGIAVGVQPAEGNAIKVSGLDLLPVRSFLRSDSADDKACEIILAGRRHHPGRDLT